MSPLPEVWLVDDHEPFRQSTALLLQTEGLAVRDFDAAGALLAELPPAADHLCVVSDMRMPAMSGLELLEELKRRSCSAPVIFVTAHGDVPLAVEAMRRGAAHFIEKPFTLPALLEAIRAVMDRAKPRDPSGSGQARLARLTPRESQVLDLVVAGKLNKTIADVLGISIKTVELHRSNMMTKLEVRNVPELVRLVLECR